MLSLVQSVYSFIYISSFVPKSAYSFNFHSLKEQGYKAENNSLLQSVQDHQLCLIYYSKKTSQAIKTNHEVLKL